MFLYCHHFDALKTECCDTCHDEHSDEGYSSFMSDIVCAGGSVYDVQICCRLLAALHALSKAERQHAYREAARDKLEGAGPA